MAVKPSYEELEQRVKALEKEAAEYKQAGEREKNLIKSKAVENNFQEEGEYFKTLAEHSHDGVIIVDDSYCFSYVNRKFCRMIDYTPAELIGRDFRLFLTEETKPVVVEFYQMRQRGESPPSRYEFQIVRKDGALRWVEASSAVIKDSEGRTKTIVQLLDITARKRAEDALRKSEELYSKLVAAIPDIVVRMDIEGNVIFVNDIVLQISGYERADLEGMNMLSFIAPEDRERAMQNMALMFDGKLGPQEYHLLLKNGQKLLFEVNGDVVRDRDGAPYGIVQVCRDITERKRTEEALIESEKRYRHLVNYAPVGIYEVDWETGRFISINDVMCEMLGYSREELMDMSPIELTNEAGQRLFIERRIKSLAGERIPEHVEFEILPRHGKPMWASIYSRLVYEEGRPVRAQVVAHDVTERRKVEEKLRKSEEKYRLLADNVNDNIWILELDTFSFSYVSPSVLRITGFSAEESVGLGLHEVLPPNSLESAMKIFEEELRRENDGADPDRSRTLELEQYHKNGGTVWTEISAKFIRDAQGRPTTILGVTRDISERKTLQVQLHQAQKMEAIGTLASGIAHDFNNILQAISGNVQLILNQKELEPGILKRANEIDGAVNRATDLVRRLLTSSRKVEPELKVLDVEIELRQAVGMLKRTIPRMIGITTIVPPDIRLIYADANQFNQVLMNLGANARDAMPEGGRLIIQAKNVTLDADFCDRNVDLNVGDYIELSVTDTGQGMDEETLKNIFNPFFTTKDVGKGTGLGMTVVYGIVKSHGGIITCESKPGRGATFRIYWPMAPEDEMASSRGEVREDAIPRGRESILIVDDEKAIQEVAYEFLTDYGYSVIKAGSGEEALDVYKDKKREIDLIVMDLGMPGIGGHKTMIELRKMDPQVKVVIASGYSTNIQLKKALTAGAAGFVGKPYRLADMLRKIRDILDD